MIKIHDYKTMTDYTNNIMTQSPKKIHNYKKAFTIVCNYDLDYGSPLFLELLKEAIAAREFGLTWKAIDKHIEEKLSLMSLQSINVMGRNE